MILTITCRNSQIERYMEEFDMAKKRKKIQLKFEDMLKNPPNPMLPLILLLINKILNIIGFVDFIDQSVEWDPKHWKVSPRQKHEVTICQGNILH